ncbi:hypothetical protein I4U23_012317 [Adineta vaga]|nr:hypothetical protein I4U23_012317 [Adineta vaga]
MCYHQNLLIMMSFESLPNELLIECFQYLNGPYLFYSFDQLNIRFFNLIRSIPLHINFSQMEKSIFDKFEQIITSDAQLKQKIISLKLSNNEAYGKIGDFLSSFPLRDFIHLRSLALINLDEKDIQEHLIPMLSLLSNLYYFSFTDERDLSGYVYDPTSLFSYFRFQPLEILSSLPKSNLRKLSIPYFVFNAISLKITSLTVSVCSIDDLFELFQYAPLLKDVKIQQLIKSKSRNDLSNVMNKINTIYVKELILEESMIKFDKLELLLEHLSSLQKLSIFVRNQSDIFDANRWQTLIQSSLKHLSIFKFCFKHFDLKTFSEVFNQFQTDFWHKEHQWYTDYRLSSIYTIPYFRDHYEFDNF